MESFEDTRKKLRELGCKGTDEDVKRYLKAYKALDRNTKRDKAREIREHNRKNFDKYNKPFSPYDEWYALHSLIQSRAPYTRDGTIETRWHDPSHKTLDILCTAVKDAKHKVTIFAGHLNRGLYNKARVQNAFLRRNDLELEVFAGPWLGGMPNDNWLYGYLREHARKSNGKITFYHVDMSLPLHGMLYRGKDEKLHLMYEAPHLTREKTQKVILKTLFPFENVYLRHYFFLRSADLCSTVLVLMKPMQSLQF